MTGFEVQDRTTGYGEETEIYGRAIQIHYIDRYSHPASFHIVGDDVEELAPLIAALLNLSSKVAPVIKSE